MTDTDETLVGRLIDGRYQVTSLMARGGMSAVYRGVDTRLQRPVAIKVLDRQYAADRTWAARFEREALAAAQLHHHHVVAVHDQGVDHAGDQSHAFLVMELVDGGTLRDLLSERGWLEPALALEVTHQLLAALAAAHRAGLVHRDVKPENVLIGHGAGHRDRTDAGVVKVADFGLVRALASAGTTSSSVILGTVAYLSPEQVETGEATERSDVYSAGLLLYEMLTGQPAFSGDTALSVAYQHVNSDVGAPSAVRDSVPAALDELVALATARDPQQRPADAAALLSELERVRTELDIARVDLPVVAPPDDGHDADATVSTADTDTTARATRPHAEPAPPDDTGDHRRRRRGLRAALVAAAVVLLVGVAAGVGWLYLHGNEVEVPAIAGQQLSAEAAQQRLVDAELDVEVQQRHHDTVPAGEAIGTRPGAGTRVARDDTVTLVMSLGQPTVPDIEPGTSTAEAEAAIEEQQLQPEHDTDADAYHRSVDEGAVISVEPGPGTRLEVGATVSYGVSQGPPPTPVPDVTGDSRQDAFRALSEAGFEPYEAGTEFDADVARGDVVRTEPAAGDAPGADSPRVGVYVSNAVEVPNVVGRPLAQARSTLGERDLKVDVVDGNADGRFAFVVEQRPDGDKRVEAGETIELRVLP